MKIKPSKTTIIFLVYLYIFSPGGLFAAVPVNPAGAIQPAEARSRVIAAAEQYRGVPYRYGGLDRRGLDCSGLVYRSFRDALGIEVPRTTTGLHAWALPISETNLMPGDLVFFNTTGPLSHVGLYAGEGRFIHAASSGQKTGVIYSGLGEAYWKGAFAGAGRVLPPEEGRPASPAVTKPPSPDKGSGLYLGFGAAPSWSGLWENNFSLGGAALQAGIFGDVFREAPLRMGLELRPQWTALNVFRMSFTVSAGFKDTVRIFAGPAFTVGTPQRTVNGEGSGLCRRYIRGNSWLGEIGIALAPFSIKLPRGALAVYGELAWQSYIKEPALEDNWQADMDAALRVSTGLRYVVNLR
jgi:probable lipoprotein NlpC